MARFENGWFRFERKALFGDIGSGPYLLALWMWLLGLANVKPTKVRFKGEMREVPIGALVTGLSELADLTKIPKSSIHRSLSYLEKSNRIGQECGKNGRIITIRNWEKYQLLHLVDETPDGTFAELSRNFRGPLLNNITIQQESNSAPTISNIIHPGLIQETLLKKPDEIDAMRELFAEVFENRIPATLLSRSILAKLLITYESFDNFKTYLQTILNEPPASVSNPTWRTYIEGRLMKQLERVTA